MQPPLSLLLIDDNETFLQHAMRFLERDASLHVAATALGGLESVEKARTVQPEVILLDLSMTELSGFELIPLLLEAAPHARLVALTMLEADSYRERAFQCGAHGFVPKSRLLEELLPELGRQRAVLHHPPA